MIQLGSKDIRELKKGDLVVFKLGGGAGYGPPDKRDVDEIRLDVANGMLSEATASSVYPQYAAADVD